MSYETIALADHPTTRGPQSIASGNAAATEYSRIDPLYALPAIQSRSQLQPVVLGVSTRISERYEFSEAYVAVPGHDDGAHGGIQTEAS